MEYKPLSPEQRYELMNSCSRGIRRAERRLKEEGTDLYYWTFQPESCCIELFQLFGCGCLVFRGEIELPTRYRAQWKNFSEEQRLQMLNELDDVLKEGDRHKRPKKYTNFHLLFYLNLSEWETYLDGCPECCKEEFSLEWETTRTTKKQGAVVKG